MHASSNSQGAFVCVRACVRPGFAGEKEVHLIDNTLPANTHLSQIERGAWQQPAGGHHSQVHCGMPNHMSTHMSTHRSIHMSIRMSICMSIHMSIHMSMCMSIQPGAFVATQAFAIVMVLICFHT